MVTSARTLLVLRSRAPTTAVFPTVPLPAFSFLLACLLRSFPPMYVSSTSMGPEKTLFLSAHASRMRCPRCHAVFCVIPNSRCIFMEAMPFMLVLKRYMAFAHVAYPRLEACMTVLVFTE